MSDQFDRLRPRRADPRAEPAGWRQEQGDAEGRRALFSPAPPPSSRAPVPGTVLVSCSRCGEESALSLLAAVRTLVPSLHLPLLRRRAPSLLRCPACRQLSWVRLRVRV